MREIQRETDREGKTDKETTGRTAQPENTEITEESSKIRNTEEGRMLVAGKTAALHRSCGKAPSLWNTHQGLFPPHSCVLPEGRHPQRDGGQPAYVDSQ